MGYKNAYDVVMVASGDKDYIEAMQEVRENLGKGVEAESFKDSSAGELRRNVDEFTFLDDHEVLKELTHKQ